MTAETVLVIDDSHEIANFLAGKVLPDLGYQTLVAYDGKTARELIRSHGQYISALIVDLQLPDTSGIDLLSQLKEEGFNIPAILSTAHGSEQVAVDAFRVGVKDYLKKPIDVDKLTDSLTQIIGNDQLKNEKKNLTEQLEQQITWLQALYKVGQSVTSTLELDEVLRRIVEAGVQLTQAEEGFIALIDNKTEQLYLRAVKNIDEQRSKTLRLPVTDSLVGKVLRTGRPLRFEQPGAGSPLKVATGYLVNSLMHVPVLSKGKAFGVLSMLNRIQPRNFKEVDESLLSSLADYAAVAIENARFYQQAQDEIASRKRVEQALRTSEERYALAVRGANDGIWDWNLQTHKVYYSPRWKSMLGYADLEIDDALSEWLDRLHPDDRERVQMELRAHLQGESSPFESEYRMLHKDGSYRWVLSRGLAVQDNTGKATRIAGSQTDISLRKYAEEKLIYDAFHDALTDLPNRALLLDRLGYAIARSQRHQDQLFAVLFLDLDRFKDVNDSLGHAQGDELLRCVARFLLRQVRPTDTVARLGGDEFVVLLEEIADIRYVTLIAERIQRELAKETLLPDQNLQMTTSIGIVLSETGYKKADDVLRDADIAMYRAKSGGKNRYEIFDPAMRQRIMDRIQLENDLRHAISHNELRIFYQPILSLESGRVSGFEALVRWQHPQYGFLPPSDFIPLAEETGLIIAIDRWMLMHVSHQLRAWNDELAPENPLMVSVNLSGKHFNYPDLVEYIQKILTESKLDPHCLKLEITESAIMENSAITVAALSRFQELGIEIRMDDFGKGYSSLSYLSQFPINALKIDYLFVSTMAHGGKHADIVQAIVLLAHSLGLQVVAEGVETEIQLDQLREMGCEDAQGYYISKPISPDQVLEFLSSRINPS